MEQETLAGTVLYGACTDSCDVDTVRIFENEDDRDKWLAARSGDPDWASQDGSALMGYDTLTFEVIGRKLAAEMIAEERSGP